MDHVLDSDGSSLQRYLDALVVLCGFALVQAFVILGIELPTVRGWHLDITPQKVSDHKMCSRELGDPTWMWQTMM